MIITIDETGTLDGFLAVLESTVQKNRVRGILILACDQNGFTPAQLDPVLRGVPKPVFGGIFPAILSGRQKLERGTIVVGLTHEPRVHVVPGLSDTRVDYDDVLDSVIEELESQATEFETMFVFVDGYSTRISSLIDSVYNMFGVNLNYIGGGAGSINPEALNMESTPCLFCNQGLIKDSAVLAVTDIRSGLGVSHGWHKISGSYKVTGTIGNAIHTIDWEPAFEVYKQVVEQHSGKTIAQENFFDMAKCYPFGISRMGSEIIVRDPFTVDGTALIVATEIPQESFIDILTGDIASLVNAARTAYASSIKTFKDGAEKTIFVIDCISRVLFYGDEFDQEIEAVNPDGFPLIGVLSLGEIANCGNDYMELYNKTCVVGALAVESDVIGV
jgi:hypothetical protein